MARNTLQEITLIKQRLTIIDRRQKDLKEYLEALSIIISQTYENSKELRKAICE